MRFISYLSSPLLTSRVAFASIHVIVKEQISLTLMREGGIKSMELKGDMNLQITDPTQAQIKITLAPPPSTDFGSDLQFKQHPKVAKFGPERVIALADTSRAFPIGQSIAVLRWRYAGKDESYVPLSSMCCVLTSSDGMVADAFYYFSQLLAFALE